MRNRPTASPYHFLPARPMMIDDFLSVLAKGHLYKHLYHFTDKTNIESILVHGILSKREAKNRGVAIARYSGNQWSHDADVQKGLDNYVNLCFTKNHPMCHVAHREGRILEPKYISIDPIVLKIPDTRISLDVANKSSSALLRPEDGLKKIDRDVLYTRMNWNDPAVNARLKNAEKCEILIPTCVPPEYIKKID